MDTRSLLTYTIHRFIAANAQINDIAEVPGPQGYSGAAVAYYTVTYVPDNGPAQVVRLVTKAAPLQERQVLALLMAQGHPVVPPTYLPDLIDDQPALICQLDVSPDHQAAPADLMAQAAQGLAAIHSINRGQQATLGWLPTADDHFLEEVIFADVWAQWHPTVQDPAFAAIFGWAEPHLKQAMARFKAWNAAQWQHPTALTLIHADMQDNHVLVQAGRPYFIDWGQARYGSLYLDLPNYFTRETVPVYHAALLEHGWTIARDEFLQNYGLAGHYLGFKYLGFMLHGWRQDGMAWREMVERMLTAALHGR